MSTRDEDIELEKEELEGQNSEVEARDIEDELEEIEDEIEYIEEEEKRIESEWAEGETWMDIEFQKLKDLLSRTQADFDNFKKRTERDKEDMIFFLKSDIFKKILPRLDDIERIIKNTPEDMQSWVLFEWVISLEKAFNKDLSAMWVESFKSIWEESVPDKHDVMTQVPWKPEWIICDEFEKWYLLWDRVLRHAKVVVWAWE